MSVLLVTDHALGQNAVTTKIEDKLLEDHKGIYFIIAFRVKYSSMTGCYRPYRHAAEVIEILCTLFCPYWSSVFIYLFIFFMINCFDYCESQSQQ